MLARKLRGIPHGASGALLCSLGASTSVGGNGGIIPDASGGLVLAFNSSLSGTSNSMVANINSAGVVNWSRSLTQAVSGGYAATGLCMFGSDIYVQGSSVDTSFSTANILKYNSSGSLQWQKKLGHASANIYSRGSIAAGTDGVFVAASVGTTPAKMMLAKYDSSGALLWQRDISSTYACNSETPALATDSSGNVIVVFKYLSGGTTNVGIVMKYNSSGTLQWQKSFSNVGTTETTPYHVTTNSTGEIFISSVITVSAANKYAVMKIDSGGAFQWCKYSSLELCYSVSCDPSGRVFSLFHNGKIAKFDTDGTLLWTNIVTGGSQTAVLMNASSATSLMVLMGGNAKYWAAKIANDGSETGTYTPYSYATSSLSLTSATPTFTTSTLTDAVGSLTAGSGGATDANAGASATIYPKV